VIKWLTTGGGGSNEATKKAVNAPKATRIWGGKFAAENSGNTNISALARRKANNQFKGSNGS
jgi:hypothetical protein